MASTTPAQSQMSGNTASESHSRAHNDRMSRHVRSGCAIVNNLAPPLAVGGLGATIPIDSALAGPWVPLSSTVFISSHSCVIVVRVVDIVFTRYGSYVCRRGLLF